MPTVTARVNQALESVQAALADLQTAESGLKDAAIRSTIEDGWLAADLMPIVEAARAWRRTRPTDPRDVVEAVVRGGWLETVQALVDAVDEFEERHGRTR